MDDEQLKRELERRSQAAPFRAEELLPEVRRWTDGGVAKPARFARWAPLAGLAAAAVIVVAVVIAWPRGSNTYGPGPGEASPRPRASYIRLTPSASRITCGGDMTVADGTGIVAACSFAYVDLARAVGLTVLPGEVSAIWMSSDCVDRIASFDQTSTSYNLTINETYAMPSGLLCAGVGKVARLDLTLKSATSLPVQATANGELLPLMSDSPTPTFPSTSSESSPPSADIEPRVLTQAEFVTQLDAGTLSGLGALVNGSLVPTGAYPCFPQDCFGATLAGSIDVMTPLFAVANSDENATQLKGGQWPWWSIAKVPATGLLAMSVNADRTATYQGVVTDPNPVSISDLGSPTYSQAATPVVIAGWLSERFSLPPECPPPKNFVSDLPSRFCNPSTLGDASGSIEVQDGAYDDFAPNPTPQHPGDVPPDARFGLYLVAPRLEGGDCPNDVTPCWQWEIVGRLNTTSGEVSSTTTTTPSPTATPPSAPQTSAPALSISCDDFNGNMPPVQLIDHTGLAVKCSAALNTPYRTPPPSFLGSTGDTIQATFSFGCANDPMTTNMDLWQRPDPQPQPQFVLVADRRESSGGCMIDVGSRVVVVELSEPVDQSEVQIVDMEDGSSSVYQEDPASGLDFNLKFGADKATYATTDPISASATLNVINHASGSSSDATLGGAGHLLAFGVEQLGTNLRMGPVFLTSCQDHVVTAGDPPTQAFSKSGGFSGDDPNAALWQNWFADPQLHLPPGQWLLTAEASFVDGGCFGPSGDLQKFSSSVVVNVTP